MPVFVVIIILSLATAMAMFWIILLSIPTQDDWIMAAKSKVIDNILTIEKLLLKDEENSKKLAELSGFAGAVQKILIGGTSEKEIDKLENQNENIQNGNLKHVGILDVPGYVLQRKYDSIGKGGLHKTILIKSLELHGRKYGEMKAKQLLARMLSYPLLGISVLLAISSAVMLFDPTMAAIILGVGAVLVLVLVYAMYDDLHDKANKRRDAITRQLPAVVSKLALLVTSGMIVDRAWKETAYSQDSEIYVEMRKTSEELDNMVSPEAAYGSFIKRCNTKETTKLASAIMQNLSKGNAEIGLLLKNMAKEAWNERRHGAKRESEKANAKLLIPTILLLISILAMIMVPVGIGMQGMGM